MTAPPALSTAAERPDGHWMPLSDLVAGLDERSASGPPTDRVAITGIAAASDEVTPGSLFVAVAGTTVDGHAFIEEAVARGAAAIVVERDHTAVPGVAVVRVPDTRHALAELGASWYGRPAGRLELVGITGTVGKTSVLSMLEACLWGADPPVGTVGSLGVKVAGRMLDETGYTAPDPLLLHAELARLVSMGSRRVVMEATSHALDQGRLHGLSFGAGIFTNLLPLEHSDYHGSFRAYVEAKSRFFDHLTPGAPLVFNADDRGVRRLVRHRPVQPIACGTSRTALARVRLESLNWEGTRMALEVRRPLPRLGGGEVPPGTLPLELRCMGRSNAVNAAHAATMALLLGADPEAVAAALRAFPCARRRMEIIYRGRFTVLDDTVGHPDSISALFETVERLGAARIHIAFAVRGQRGARINRSTAGTLAIWAAQLPVATLVLTRSSDYTDPRNRVEDREWTAFGDALRDAEVPFDERDRLDDAVDEVLGRAGKGDLVLLLGAQGMDGGQEIARAWLAEQGDTSRP